MSPAAAVDLNAFGAAITRAIVEGNRPLLDSLAGQADKRHDLRGQVQINTDKVYELDSEVKLIKGMMVSLVGSGDGSSGIVPRLEGAQKSLGEDVATVKGDVKKLGSDVTTLCADVKAMRDGLAAQKSWTDGWKGVGVALAIIGACLSAIVMLMAIAYKLVHEFKP